MMELGLAPSLDCASELFVALPQDHTPCTRGLLKMGLFDLLAFFSCLIFFLVQLEVNPCDELRSPNWGLFLP